MEPNNPQPPPPDRNKVRRAMVQILVAMAVPIASAVVKEVIEALLRHY
jgi:hypothetical protein